jgi:hypothetical protein
MGIPIVITDVPKNQNICVAGMCMISAVKLHALMTISTDIRGRLIKTGDLVAANNLKRP